MTGYLLDTDVISMFAPGRKPIAQALADWAGEKADRLYISVISIGEVEAGVAKLHRDGATARAGRLAMWFDRLLSEHHKRILPFDRDVAHIYGSTLDRALAAGHDPGFADAAIAATAIHFELRVVTRNLRHFRHFGAPLLNPDDL